MGYKLKYSNASYQVFEVVLYIVTMVLTLFGNALVCVAVYRNVRLRTSTNVFIIALAIIGLVCGVFMQPIAVFNSIKGEMFFGHIGCSLYGYFGHVVSYVIISTMALTALNRFVRVVKPQQYRRHFSTKRSISYSIALWVFVAVIISSPLVFGFGEFSFDEILSGCAFEFSSDAGKLGFYGLLNFLFGYLPMGVIIVCYYKVFKAIRQHNVNVQGNNNSALGVEEVKLTKTVFALFIGFLFSWFPMNIFVTIRFVFDDLPADIGGLVTWFVFLSAALNPYIYGALNSAFNREFRKILKCQRTGRRILPSES